MKEILGYLLNGKLSPWMRDHDYPIAACRAVEELLKTYERKALLFKKGSPEDERRFTKRITDKLCEIFEIKQK